MPRKDYYASRKGAHPPPGYTALIWSYPKASAPKRAPRQPHGISRTSKAETLPAANDLKKAELIAEINVLLGVAGLGKKQRTPAQIAARRQRTRFRRELGLAVAQHLRDGDKEKDIRARHGVSGFTVSRAYGWIKRHHFRDKDMSNEEMRRRLRAEGKQQQEEERASSPDGESTADKREELERLREQARRMVELARREDPAFCADMDDDEY